MFKTNFIEFHSEVYRALTRHKSTFATVERQLVKVIVKARFIFSGYLNSNYMWQKEKLHEFLLPFFWHLEDLKSSLKRILFFVNSISSYFLQLGNEKVRNCENFWKTFDWNLLDFIFVINWEAGDKFCEINFCFCLVLQS